MEPFLNKFVSLVKHLLENSHKVQIVQSADHYQTSLFCSRLTQEMSAHTLVLNVDVESYLNNYQQDFFLDWAADQFEELLKKDHDKFDSPWLFVITQAHLLDTKNIEQLLTLKHQRENAQLHLLFEFPEDFDIEQSLGGIDDPIITEQNYHIHSLCHLSTNKEKLISSKKLISTLAALTLIFLALFLYHPEILVKKPAFDQSPAELFTDNSLDTWSDETQEKIEKLRDEIETQSEQELEDSLEDELNEQGDDFISQEQAISLESDKIWSWQLIAFNTRDKANYFREKNCQSLCSIAQNNDYYVVLFGQYLSYSDGLIDKSKAHQIISNPWLRNTSELKGPE